MAQNQPSKTAAKRRSKRRSRSRTWIWGVVTAVLALALIGVGITGLCSDSSLRSAIEAQREENKQQEEIRRALSAEGEEKDARLAAAEEAIAEKDARIESLQADNADKDAQLETLAADNADKDAQIERLRADNADKDAQIDAVQADLADQDARLRDLTAENAEKGAQLEALAAEDADRDARIESLNADLAEKDARIDALSADGSEKDARIDACSAELASKDQQISGLNAGIAEKDGEIQARTDASAGRDAQIDTLSRQIADADALVPEEPVFESPDASEASEAGPQPDAWGYVDEDGDGLILVPIRGKFTGYMLIVLDPSRVVVGCEPKDIGSRGYDVRHFVEKEDGVAGINGGGFLDAGGQGDGSTPDRLFVHEGEVHCGGSGIGYGFAGLDDQYVLHVGISSQEVESLHIMEGCGYGPVLIKDGEMTAAEKLHSGLNPRTAIGQRSDGAILMLVTEGRQPSRIGCSYIDEAELMLSFGAVNAVNMDGGSSTMMWYEGEYINNRANVIFVRTIPTSWVVLKEGRGSND